MSRFKIPVGTTLTWDDLRREMPVEFAEGGVGRTLRGSVEKISLAEDKVFIWVPVSDPEVQGFETTVSRTYVDIGGVRMAPYDGAPEATYTVVGDWYGDGPEAFVKTVEAVSPAAAVMKAAGQLKGSGHCEDCEDANNVFTGAQCAYIIAVFTSQQPLSYIEGSAVGDLIVELDRLAA